MKKQWKKKNIVLFMILLFLCICVGMRYHGMSVLANNLDLSETEENMYVPGLMLEEPVGKNLFYDTDRKIYWFSDKNIRIPVTIREESEEKTGPYIISYSVDSQFLKATEIEISGNEAIAEIELESAGDVVTYYFKVSDTTGTESAVQSLQLAYDDSSPETKAYIRFFSDTAGANDESCGEITDGKWSGNIYEIAQKSWKKIWGKKNIRFEVYVKDACSGIAEITMKYNDKVIPAQKLRRAEGWKTFLEGTSVVSDADSAAEGYTVFEGTIVSDQDKELAVRDFEISSITDSVGNTVKQRILLNDAKNEAFIYLDNTSPVLNVQMMMESEYHTVDTEEKYYAKEVKEILLTIEEHFFAQENSPVYPKVEIRKRSDATGVFETDPMLTSKAWKHIRDDFWQLGIRLGNTDEEMEYQMVMETYEDPSGNVLTGAENVTGVSAKGEFTSKIFVIDKIAPILTDYCVIGQTDCRADDVSIYKNIDDGDASISFTIDEHPEYYEPENLSVEIYCVGQKEPVMIMSGTDFQDTGTATLTVDGRKHTYEFSYNGVEGQADEYYLTISYTDRAGNELMGKDVQDGIFRSSSFIIDHEAPIFDITYETDAVNVVREGNILLEKKPLDGCIAYYNKDIELEFVIEESYVHFVDDVPQHFEFELWELTNQGKHLANDITPTVKREEDGKFKVHYTISADMREHKNDGNYQLVVKYRDCADNFMVSQNESDAELLKDGVYTSPILVLDTIAPKVMTKYMSESVQTYQERDYFKTHTVFNLLVKDKNMRYGDLRKNLSEFTAQAIDGTPVLTSLGEELKQLYEDTKVWRELGEEPAELSVDVILKKDANYEIPVYFTDLAGNAADVTELQSGKMHHGGYCEKVTIDTERPKLELSYSVEDPANYLKNGYLFAKKEITITLTAEDRTAGIQKIRFTIVDENGKESVETQSFETGKEGNCSVVLPLQTKDFKGSVLAEVFDCSANINSQKRGHVIESVSKHSETGKAQITTLTAPGRTVNGVDYYNADVKLKLLLEDTYSGLGSWKYTVGNTLKEQADYKMLAGTDFHKEPAMEIVHTMERTLILNAKENNANQILAKAGFIDNAGNTLEVQKEYHIDVTKPEITVTYDINEPMNQKYYRDTRTATVEIRERNFDAADVQFLFTSTEGSKPTIGDWIHSGSGDEQIHKCTVEFCDDSDYTFTIKFTDMAGNAAEYDRIDEFTIDKTAPAATITYDHNRYLNDHYYKESRTATIDIEERNFEPSAMKIMITADGSTEHVSQISGWSQNGNHHIATITFDADAEYTFDIAGADLAGNKLADYAADHFIIDRTAPKLEIFGIKDRSANRGVVRPGIRWYDKNNDAAGAELTITGCRNGVMTVSAIHKQTENGMELELEDFPHDSQMDDIYTMKVCVQDLAGNKNEAAVTFSVNRFGSVYTFDEATEALLGEHGKYYTNKAQPLVIMETNADTLEFKEITINRDGELKRLREELDYIVEMEGSESSWKQYTYTLKEENFMKEGTYIVTIYSQDKAANSSDNHTKGKKIEFVMDKTPPSVLISGIENRGQYRVHSRELTIDMEDNVRLSQAVVTVNGVETVYDAEEINAMDGKLILTIESANHWQNIGVVVTDAAGNEEVLENMQVLVTANLWVQFFMNKPLFFGVTGGGIISGLFLWILQKKLRISLFNSSSP